MTMEQMCHNTCCGKVLKEIPDGCQEEKCLVNLNFHTGPFLVFECYDEFQNAFLDSYEKEKIQYNNFLTPNYNVVIWQPPEYTFAT